MKIQFQNQHCTVFESALYRTTTTVVEWGKGIVIVDPNWLPEEVEFIRFFVQDRYPDRSQILVFTHSDYDHIIGYGAFPDARVMAGLDFVENPKKEENINQINSFDDQFYITRSYPVSYPVVDEVISVNGQKISRDGEEAIFYQAPGHVQNGLIIVLPHKKLCIVGDYLSNIEIPMVEFSFEAYAKTLITLRKIVNEFPVEILVTGHGDMAFERVEIEKRIETDLDYLHLFTKDTYQKDELFIPYIQAKGNPSQNRLIHENNVSFFNKIG